MIALRNATTADLLAIVTVQQHCYGEHFLESADSLRAKLAATPETCWLAHRDGEALGYLLTLPVDADTFPAFNAQHFFRSAAPTLFYLHDLAVTPAGRSLNIGRQLLEKALAAATASGLAAAGLIAVQASRDYWCRHGFAEVDASSRGLLKKVASFGEDARYMERALP